MISSSSSPIEDGLLELAERCEAAAGPDIGLNVAIALACDVGLPAGTDRRLIENLNTRLLYSNRVTDFTASLDAAMTLVPEGWHLAGLYDRFYTRRWHSTVAQLPTKGQLRAFDAGKTFGVQSEHGEAATGPLALCAAALRARALLAHQEQGQ
jgi:hypothetical protein